jgi:uncharacterized membrane protein (UPF0127 family)
MKGFVLILLTASLVTACANAQQEVELNGQRYTVELAQSREETSRGLMFVESMPENHGMLFIFDQEIQRSFWMKNTRIPLDIMYFDAELALVSVARNARPCVVQRCPGYPSEGPAKYVLELNAGQADRLEAAKGDVLVLLFDL